jgi:urease beta subunit
MIPGEIIVADGDIVLNEGRETTTLSVANTGDRPVQVGSHYHTFSRIAHLFQLIRYSETLVRHSYGPDPMIIDQPIETKQLRRY